MKIREWIYVFTVIFALAIVAILFNFSDRSISPVAKAEARMQLLAHRLIINNFQQKLFLPESSPQDQASSQRGLASAGAEEAVRRSLRGEVGRDPWGRPIQYRVFGEGQAGDYMILRASGPDGVFQTNENSEENTGDDVLVRVEIKG